MRASLDSGNCQVGRLIVHPDYQGKGIGTLLMNRIETISTRADRFELFTGVKSINNIQLYQSLDIESTAMRICRPSPTRVYGKTTMSAILGKTEKDD